jgi:hypothetical protein
MMEFEKHFLPKTFEKRTTEKPTDARALGISMAKDFLDRIREQLGN